MLDRLGRLWLELTVAASSKSTARRGHPGRDCRLPQSVEQIKRMGTRGLARALSRIQRSAVSGAGVVPVSYGCNEMLVLSRLLSVLAEGGCCRTIPSLWQILLGDLRVATLTTKSSWCLLLLYLFSGHQKRCEYLFSLSYPPLI
jgi:hypothetical protein